jgi:hypothetical protein
VFERQVILTCLFYVARMRISSNHDTDLSLTGERGKTKSAPKIPQVRRLVWKITEGRHKKARPFLWEWIFTGLSGTSR